MNTMQKTFAVYVRIQYNINSADRSCSKIQTYHTLNKSDKLGKLVLHANLVINGPHSVKQSNCLSLV